MIDGNVANAPKKLYGARFRRPSGERVEIQPIHYVYSEGWIYGRT